MQRCTWAEKEIFHDYHDNEWGVPVHDDNKHFEMITLEGAQAGLSWETILKKREEYRKVFSGFDPKKVSKMSDSDQKNALHNPGIIRNKLKVGSTVTNARAFLEIQKEFGTFDKYIWSFVENKSIVNNLKSIKDFPSSTPLSDKISKDLKKRGFRFVGSTIIYAYLQAVGIIDDHEIGCFCHNRTLIENM